MIVCYTDGSCLNNGGIPEGEVSYGGWGVVVLEDKEIKKELSGGATNTTNNRMELQAVLEALRATEGSVLVRTDSKLTICCATKEWKRKANTDLWEQYDKEALGRDVVFEWVRGHNGEIMNERADRLATQAASSIKLEHNK